MIPLDRPPVPARTQNLLAKRTATIAAAAAAERYDTAVEQWRIAAAPKKHVRGLLRQMAAGVERCMYCEDNQGTDIDHFQPIADDPLRAFDWLNHLLACSHCNSNTKGHKYPRDDAGACLLIDPTVEDPAAHLVLFLASGTYEGITPKGMATIEVFGLNRPTLVRGRRAAFVTAKNLLRDWYEHRRAGRTEEADEIVEAISESPFSAVVRAILNLPEPAAPLVVGAVTLPAIDAWRRDVAAVPRGPGNGE
ncbi:hypothetical protein ACTVZO_42465 [Streptomyces sp. IBSNAI002]|uniref:hypothetical protein n=1 Tax=Streptomyces sp. IBSNAI002 TaxID=3457500 RepID=UPI003FD0174C